MYVMAVLICGSLLVGCASPLSHRRQTGLALLAATIGTIVYFVSQRAM